MILSMISMKNLKCEFRIFSLASYSAFISITIAVTCSHGAGMHTEYNIMYKLNYSQRIKGYD